MEVKVYTDGACSGNPGPGAFAYIIVDSNDNVLLQYSQGVEITTNNRMELMAVIMALKECCKKGYDNIVVYSDSQYVVNAINKGWLIDWQKNNFKKTVGDSVEPTVYNQLKASDWWLNNLEEPGE